MLLASVPFAIFLAQPAAFSAPGTIPGDPASNEPRAATYSGFGMQGVTFSQSTPPKWQRMAMRHETQIAEGSRSWEKLLGRFTGVEELELLRHVNLEVNRAAYVPDAMNWRTPDHWGTPQELLERGGDCEDYAIAKYFLLRALSINPSHMQIAVDNAHAFLIVTTDAGAFVLDNRYSELRYLHADDLKEVVFTVNEFGWTVNVGRGSPVRTFAAARRDLGRIANK